jgi:hypothetical protein
MEGYSMFEDGYVLDVKTTTCSPDNGQHFHLVKINIIKNSTLLTRLYKNNRQNI